MFMKNLQEALNERILVLDGALGTMIQRYRFKEEDFRGREFLTHPIALSGFNDILNITKPATIQKIHSEYLEAGADIITTNTFNANSVSMKDYGMGDMTELVERINREGARIAKESVDAFEKLNSTSKLHFVGGSIGPTNRSTSMSPDISDPLKRNISYDELFEAYKIQIRALIEGGIDLLVFETFFDTLNLKAGLAAANIVLDQQRIKLPILVSATVSDNAGRLLSGQTLDAFLTSVAHYPNVTVIGLNCGFGPDRMTRYLHDLNKINPHFTSCHPNAGLPDEMGNYNVDPEEFCADIKLLLENEEINIVGGCCGTTPDYIKKLSELAKNYKPRKLSLKPQILRLSGLEMLEIKDDFIKVGERCNVAGSSKFLKLIKEGFLEEAAEVAKKQIINGAKIIDINMDDPLLDSEKEMVEFIRYILAEPEVAKVPFMIDSSKWDVIVAALKNIQGKGIINSISLKEGEEIFIEKAKKVRELGFALVVMAFDEKGQADTYERKIEICERSYRLLTEKCGFPPEDIFFDVNIMTIATGMKEHDLYALDFLRAISWIKENLPGAKTSGGVSNLSFAFRGKNKIREYMHEIFLYHAKIAGLDMAIVNPASQIIYQDIPEDIRTVIEDLIFARGKEDTVDRLISMANSLVTVKTPVSNIENSGSNESNIEEVLKNDLIKGELIGLEPHLKVALEKIKDPVKIIEGPLLEGMKQVGSLFGEGKMFLPQVVKTARSMKRAVEILTPHLEKAFEGSSDSKAGKILIATVKGDVHDIGKNIVSTVLTCNNYEVIDLGIMVPGELIVEKVLTEKPDIICLSGLITPSLAEMTETVKLLAKAGVQIPVMVGGAATSPMYTVLKIVPEYGGPVLHMVDASQNPIAASKLLNKNLREEYLKEIDVYYSKLKEKSNEKVTPEPYSKVLEIVKKEERNHFIGPIPKFNCGEVMKIKIPVKEIIPLINWKMFLTAWKITGIDLDIILNSELRDNDSDKLIEARRLKGMAEEILNNSEFINNFDGQAIIRVEKAKGDEKNIYISHKTFPMLRQQSKDSGYLSCSDFIGEEDYIGLFTVTAGKYCEHLYKKYDEEGDSLKALIVQTLADRLVEAASEWLQGYVSENYFKVAIRPAWGYPMLPDQTLILETLDFLPYNEIGVSLTENGAMYPPSSISGLYIGNPDSKYFSIGQIGDDQLKDYAQRREMSEDRIKDILRHL